MTQQRRARRGVCLGFAVALFWHGDALAFELPAQTIADLQAAADSGRAPLAAEARRQARLYPELAREIRLEVLALALENAVAAAPGNLEPLLAGARRAAAERDLLSDSADLTTLRRRAEAAAQRGRVRQQGGLGGIQGEALAVSQNQRAALDALADAALAEMQAAPRRAEAIADEAILIARERRLPITPDFVDRLRRRATFLSLQTGSDAAATTSRPTAAERPETARAPSPQARPEGESEAERDSRGWPTKTTERMRNERSLTSGWLPFAITGGVLGAGTLIAFAIDGSSEDDPPTADDFITDEYTGSGFLDTVDAAEAYARGATGQGRIVAISSAGVDVEHPELAGQIAPGGVDLVDGDADPNPVGAGSFRSNGTAYASLAAGRRGGPALDEFPIPLDEEMPPPQTQGVAPDARILPIRRMDSAGASAGALIDAIDIAISAGADVFLDDDLSPQPLNSETGGPFVVREYSIAEENAFLRGAAAGMIFVVPTGGGEESGMPLEAAPEALAPQEFPEIEPFFVAVSGSGSNPCGGAANWCLTAPDSGLVAAADLNDGAPLVVDGYAQWAGSGGAAAIVSGAVAVLKSRFPDLSAQDIRTILLLSADDIGDPGIDPLTGHGQLNLERATRPLGENGIELGATLGEMTMPLEGSMMVLSSAFGGTPPAGLDRARLGFLDGFDRSYTLPLTGLTRRAAPEALDSRMAWFGRRPVIDAAAPLTPGGRATLSLTMAATDTRRRIAQSPTDQTTHRQHQWHAETRYAGFSATMVQGRIAADGLFGLAAAGRIDPSLSLGLSAFANPYLGLLEAPRGYAAAGRLGPTIIRSGMVTGRGGDRAIIVEAQNATAHDRLWSLQAGMLTEASTLLGARFEGGFGLREDSTTWFVGSAGALPLGERVSLIASGFLGRTLAAPADRSLFTGLDPLWSGTLALGLAGDGLLRPQDRMTISLSRPLRIVAGGAVLRLPQGREGLRIDTETQRIDFSAGDTPIALRGSYRWPGAAGTMLSSGFALRLSGAETGPSVSGDAVIRLTKPF